MIVFNVAALKDTVTEENVYSDEYIRKLLDVAGKGYFAHVDRANLIYSQIYDVATSRHLSMGMTGYEVRTSSMYGIPVGLGEGSFAAGTIGTTSVLVLGLFDMLFIGEEMNSVVYAMDLYYRAMHGDEKAEQALESYNAVKGTTILVISMLFGVLNKMLAREGAETKVEEVPEEVHGESGLNSINHLDDLLANPKKLAGVSGEELYNYLLKNGYDVKPLGKGSFKGIPFEEGGGFKVNWGGDRILQYHPESLVTMEVLILKFRLVKQVQLELIWMEK